MEFCSIVRFFGGSIKETNFLDFFKPFSSTHAAVKFLKWASSMPQALREGHFTEPFSIGQVILSMLWPNCNFLQNLLWEATFSHNLNCPQQVRFACELTSAVIHGCLWGDRRTVCFCSNYPKNSINEWQAVKLLQYVKFPVVSISTVLMFQGCASPGFTASSCEYAWVLTFLSLHAGIQCSPGQTHHGKQGTMFS